MKRCSTKLTIKEIQIYLSNNSCLKIQLMNEPMRMAKIRAFSIHYFLSSMQRNALLHLAIYLLLKM